MSILDSIDFSDRKTQLVAGGVVIVGALALRGLAGGRTVTEASVSNEYGTVNANGEPGVVGWVGNADPTSPRPPDAQPKAPEDKGEPGTVRPGRGSGKGSGNTDADVAAVVRANTDVMQKPQPAATVTGAGVQAAPGRVAGLQMGDDSSATVRAQPAASSGTGRTQTNSDRSGSEPVRTKQPVPSAPKQTQPKGMAKGRQLAAAGEGIADIDDDVNPREWGPFANSVGGFDPYPAMVAATVSAEVRAGESLGDVSARLYGTRSHAAKLLAMNPDLLSSELRGGDPLRVM